MLTPVERVLILKNIDLLKDLGPRHLLGLADVAQELEMWSGQPLFDETDRADALYVVVEGRVRLVVGEKPIAEVGTGEAFGTWALVDDSQRGQRAECVEDGLVLALDRDDFYEVAADDPALLREMIRVLAKRLRALVAERPEEARIEEEGTEEPEAAATPAAPDDATAGRSLAAAALGHTVSEPPHVGEGDDGEPPAVPGPRAAPPGET